MTSKTREKVQKAFQILLCADMIKASLQGVGTVNTITPMKLTNTVYSLLSESIKEQVAKRSK